MGFIYGNCKCVDPKEVASSLANDSAFTLSRNWYGSANRYSCPLGDKPGKGLVLLRRIDLNAMNFFEDTAEWDLQITDDLRRLTIPNLIAMPPYCITPGIDNDDNAIYAVELADARYWLWQKFHNDAYNVRLSPGGDYINATTHDGLGTPWTWDQLGNALWTASIGTGWPGWPYTPDGTPEGWHFWMVPSIQALQAVARRLACSIRYNPFTQAYDIVQLGGTDSTFDDSVNAFQKRYRIWDEDQLNVYRATIPENIRTVFRKVLADDDGNPYDYVDTAFPTSLTSESGATLASYAKAGSIAIIWDDLYSTGTNGSNLSSRATERSTYYAQLCRYFYPSLSRWYRGIGTVNDLFIGPRCASITLQDIGAGIQTVIQRGPLEPIEWGAYLQGAGENVTGARCVGGDIEETLLTTWGGGKSPLRFS